MYRFNENRLGLHEGKGGVPRRGSDLSRKAKQQNRHASHSFNSWPPPTGVSSSTYTTAYMNTCGAADAALILWRTSLSELKLGKLGAGPWQKQVGQEALEPGVRREEGARHLQQGNPHHHLRKREEGRHFQYQKSEP